MTFHMKQCASFSEANWHIVQQKAMAREREVQLLFQDDAATSSFDGRRKAAAFDTVRFETRIQRAPPMRSDTAMGWTSLPPLGAHRARGEPVEATPKLPSPPSASASSFQQVSEPRVPLKGEMGTAAYRLGFVMDNTPEGKSLAQTSRGGWNPQGGTPSSTLFCTRTPVAHPCAEGLKRAMSTPCVGGLDNDHILAISSRHFPSASRPRDVGGGGDRSPAKHSPPSGRSSGASSRVFVASAG